MNYGKKYLENQILTSNPVTLTVLVYDNILDKIKYIKENLDFSDIDSFGSEQSLEKVDKIERLVEELYMGISTLTEKPFPTIAQRYSEIISLLSRFIETKNMSLLDNISVLVSGLKEGYEGVVKRDA